MKLNIGCGEFKNEGWIDIDKAPEAEPDVLASVVDGLPHADDSAELVYCGHVLEHLSPEEISQALREVYRVAEPGAEVVFVGPDVPRAAIMLQAGILSQETYEGLVHGACRWDGDEHHWECSEGRMLKFVQEVFPDARPLGILEVDRRWPVVSRVAYQCAVVAKKPDG